MKITSLTLFHVQPRWLFLKIETDEGISGWGEPIVEGRARTVETAIKEMESYLIGKDPLKIEHHWQVLYKGSFYRGGAVLTSALSGIEQALWDIKGKYYNIPVYEMLGGSVREKVRMYSHCHGYQNNVGLGQESIDMAVSNAMKKKEMGFNAIKLSMECPARHVETYAFLERQVNKIAAIREAVGAEMDIAVDFHGRISPAMSVRLAQAFEPFYPMFIEEPCLPDNVDAMVKIANSTTIPIAAGERLFTRWGYRESFEKQAVAIVQPDLCHAGGIFESRKIAAMAETYHVSIAPHNPLGPISLASCLQLAACTPNFLVQEHPSLTNKWDLGEGYLHKPFIIENGYITVPTGPGLGIEVNEEVIKERAFDGSWETPRVFHKDDGSFAEW
ncbi:galactonate dehydratase [Cytobacillus oceanisediminis]|uniref:galactonate dehydratase n=1 Tax=Cytobacillus oceanisediminis TaxID=665099 RepID=UPI00119CCA1A|nr:galactonate dehydratase [Cytobacillus oceanisediminis]MBZ9535810.1 galactonate dehydratase [Cytobacillus oceanisediminis]